MINPDESTTDYAPLLVHQAERLETLAARLRRIAEGTAPTVAELDAARQLDGWHLGRREVPVLEAGDDTGPQVVTPDVHVLAPVSGWALCSAGWVALGDRRPPSA